ncbi:MAG: tyrosine-type recombinase/integrase [Verrucomicrobia bacterium]|nr:tyrosine-type recombinase/integrase [Verrucomicrobiota bacterium]
MLLRARFCRLNLPGASVFQGPVLLLLARLGLRTGEVASLCSEDIHWAEGRLLIRAGKSHRERTLPLKEQIGQALVDLCSIVGRALPRVFLAKGARPLNLVGSTSVLSPK